MVWIRELFPEWAQYLFIAFSLLGDLAVIVPAIALLTLFEAFKRARSEIYTNQSAPLCSYETVSLVAIILGGLSLIVVLEFVFAMPRPPAEYHVVQPSEFGFPSGHTMAAVIFWGAIARWGFLRLSSFRYYLITIIISLVAFSRIALGVHYVVDVIAGIIFGLMYLLFIGRLVYGKPMIAFGCATLIALVALFFDITNPRALLAFGGTVGIWVTWIVVEHDVIRVRIIALINLIDHRLITPLVSKIES